MHKCVLLSLLSVLMASSTMQSGLKPCVLDSRPSREAIFSLTELSVSWERTAVASDVFFSVQLISTQPDEHYFKTLYILLPAIQHGFISVLQRLSRFLVTDYSKSFLVMTHDSLPCSSAPTGSWPHPPRSPSPQACAQTAAGTAGHQWSSWPCRGQCAEPQTYWVWTDAAFWRAFLHGESVSIKHLKLKICSTASWIIVSTHGV